MARIIEYDEGSHGESRGNGGSGAAVLVIVILLLLYFSGYLPGFTTASTSLERRIVTPAATTLPISSGSISYVTAERLNMRESPGAYSPARYILPRGTRVTYLGGTYREPNGDLWIQVQIETYEGLQVGWVNRQYIS